jgi:hypothetical protein
MGSKKKPRRHERPFICFPSALHTALAVLPCGEAVHFPAREQRLPACPGDRQRPPSVELPTPSNDAGRACIAPSPIPIPSPACSGHRTINTVKKKMVVAATTTKVSKNCGQRGTASGVSRTMACLAPFQPTDAQQQTPGVTAIPAGSARPFSCVPLVGQQLEAVLLRDEHRRDTHIDPCVRRRGWPKGTAPGSRPRCPYRWSPWRSAGRACCRRRWRRQSRPPARV